MLHILRWMAVFREFRTVVRSRRICVTMNASIVKRKRQTCGRRTPPSPSGTAPTAEQFRLPPLIQLPRGFVTDDMKQSLFATRVLGFHIASAFVFC